MVMPGCVLVWETILFLWLLYRGIMYGAEWLRCWLGDLGVRGGCSFISIGTTVLDFLGAGLVPTTSYRKGNIMITIVIYSEVSIRHQGWFQSHLYYLIFQIACKVGFVTIILQVVGGNQVFCTLKIKFKPLIRKNQESIVSGQGCKLYR